MRARAIVSLILAAALLPLLAPATPAQQGKPPVFVSLDIEILPGGEERVRYKFTYETCFYSSRFRDFFLPTGMTATRIWDDETRDLPVLRQGDGTVDFDAKYDCSGRRPIHFALAHEAPSAKYAPVYRGNTTLGAFYNNLVTVTITAAEGVLLRAAAPDARVGADGKRAILWSNETPGSGFDAKYVPVTYAWEDHTLDGWTFQDAGVFRVVAPADFASTARAIAENATAPLAAATQEAGLPPLANGTFALFTEGGAFLDFEAGHYSGRLPGEAGVIAIKLTHARAQAAGLSHTFNRWQGATSTLVHEAFHAASVPHIHEIQRVGWWVEGTANHAESHAERAHASAANASACDPEAGACDAFRDRISYDELVSLYRAEAPFNLTWRPSEPQPDAARGRMYDHARFIVGAYVHRAGTEAYRAAWQAIRDAAARPACACDAALVERALLTAANGTLTPEELYFPYRTLLQANETAFKDAVRAFVDDMPPPPAEPATPAPPPEEAFKPRKPAPSGGEAPPVKIVVEDPPEESQAPSVEPPTEDAPSTQPSPGATPATRPAPLPGWAPIALLGGASALARRAKRRV